MDLHPTPFPGKRRPAAANPTEKDRDRTKLPAPPTRPKRAFGVARSTNIPIEKPLSKPSSAKICKPWKPSGNAPQKASDNISRSGSDNAKAGIKKNQHVCFQEVVETIERSGQDDGVRTPKSTIKAVVVGTPYQSAENCSKCRFDRMETTSYWLAQIKIAESVGKHFVSAAFFRLALECHAQPFLSLQSELKHYVVRHKAISSETLWGDLCQAYGLSTDHPNADPCDLDKFDAILVEQEDSKPNTRDEVNCETLKNECFEFDIIDNPPLDVSEKEPAERIDTNLAEPKDNIGIKETVHGRTMPSSSQGSPSKKKSGGNKSLEGHVSGKKSYGEKSNTLPLIDSSSNIRSQRSGGSADKGGRETLNQPQPGTKTSGGKPLRRNAAGARVRQSSQLRNQAKEDEKGTSPNLSDNFNSEGTEENVTANQGL